MTTPTEYQTIEYHGQPAFVLVPWEQFKLVRPLLDAEQARTNGIPQEVVEAHILGKVSMIRAWREYLAITQAELAGRMGVSQAAIAKFERPAAKPRRATLNHIATTLGITTAQLAW